MTSYEDVGGLPDPMSDGSHDPFSIGKAEFSLALDECRAEAQAIQDSLHLRSSHVSQLDSSARMTPVRSGSTSRIVADVQSKLEKLEAERRELDRRMDCLEELPDLSITMSNIPSTRGMTSHATDISSVHDIELESLRQRNGVLQMQLEHEREQRQATESMISALMGALTSQYQSFAARVSYAIADREKHINDITDKVEIMASNCNQDRAARAHVYNEISGRRDVISTSLDEFKDALYTAKSAVMARVKQADRSTSRTRHESIFVSPMTRRSRGDASFSSPKTRDGETRLLASACDELTSSIASRFQIATAHRPAIELVTDATEFAKYISSVCSANAKGIQKLNDELQSTKDELDEARSIASYEGLSPEVAETIRRIVSSLNRVSEDMTSQHQVLMSKLPK